MNNPVEPGNPHGQYPPPPPPPPGQPSAPFGAPDPIGTPSSPPRKAWWKRRIAKLPVVAWLALLAVVIIAVATQGGKKDEKEAANTKPPTSEQTTKTDASATQATESGVVAPGAAKSTDPTTAPEASEPTAAESSTPAATGGGKPADDVSGCSIVDENTILIDLVNNSSKMSDYFIDVNYLDGSGQRIADETTFINYVRPAEKVSEESYAFKAKGAATCEIAKVTRMAAESSDDVSEVACQIKGVNALDAVDVGISATNGSSKTSDYLVTATLTRDDVRVGTAFGTIKNVTPGSSAPGEAFSTVDGPADTVTCEVVNVTRMES